MGSLASAPQLRGREGEIAKPGEALDRAVCGPLTAVLIEGEAGIGKSRLLTVAADLLARAAGLMEPADPGRDRLLAERASSLMLAGQIGDAAAAEVARHREDQEASRTRVDR